MSYDPYIFQTGESVILSVEIMDNAGSAYVDPTSITVTIKNPAGSFAVGGTAGGTPMAKDSTGHFHYDFNSTTSSPVGKWTVTYEATTGTRIVKKKDSFHLEAA
jgi:hypothetical protein